MHSMLKPAAIAAIVGLGLCGCTHTEKTVGGAAIGGVGGAAIGSAVAGTGGAIVGGVGGAAAGAVIGSRS